MGLHRKKRSAIKNKKRRLRAKNEANLAKLAATHTTSTTEPHKATVNKHAYGWTADHNL